MLMQGNSFFAWRRNDRRVVCCENNAKGISRFSGRVVDLENAFDRVLRKVMKWSMRNKILPEVIISRDERL